MFSPVTEWVIVFTLTAPVWFAGLLYAGQPARRVVLAVGVTLGWAVLGVAVVRYHADAALLADSPVRPLIYLAVPTVLVVVFRRRLTMPPLSQRLLVALQLFRVIGAVFILEYARGVLPAVFALPAGIGDIAVSVIAAVILLRYRDRPIPSIALITLFVAGIADFTSAFFFGLTSAASPLQLFAVDHPNPVDRYPTGLIPYCLVPVAVAAHVLSLTQLRRPSERPERIPEVARIVR